MPYKSWRFTAVVLFVVLLSSACEWSPSVGGTVMPTGSGPDQSNETSAQSLVPMITMIPIVQPGEAGGFMMGSSDEELQEQSSLGRDQDYYTDDEQPLHQVTLTVPYAVSKYEITNEQFCTVMNWAIDQGRATISSDQLRDATSEYVFLGLDADAETVKAQHGIVVDGSHLKPAEGRQDHPMNAVTWYGAVAFCNYLSEMSGLEPAYYLETWSWDAAGNGYRLPTEAEWEYAARGTNRHVYAWGDHISSVYVSYGSTRPVGFFDGADREGIATNNNASPFGIYDMTGSVWEWVWDWYSRVYYAQSPATDPLGPESGDGRPPYHADEPTKVWRGGGWMAPIGWGYLRVAKRWSCAPYDYYSETGFRIAQTLH